MYLDQIIPTVFNKNGAQVITESIGEIHESPKPIPFKLALISPFLNA